ncbi:hypothetical protein NXS98_09965 [Fontisphaera persica]|uniref:hypothetical protein n=1 Tax=Fontisphaera persica TaxID=2974023 RepID=UPI0024BF83B1|nr:hypothetical protein [Fontisphaera persica]WCJ58052.1 hypothetical protein NXS98_09965 [Fontisphaera persica]
MAIPLKNLMAEGKGLSLVGSDEQRCCYCNVLLQETITGKRKTPEGEACSDCYYEKLGAGVEQHPLICGRVGRG